MDLEWVQAFLAVADTGSFSAAADALFLSQPVISKQVQKLEHQLGVRLFDRAHRRAELTDAGRRAYPPAAPRRSRNRRACAGSRKTPGR